MLKHLSTGFNSRDLIKIGSSVEPFFAVAAHKGRVEKNKKEELWLDEKPSGHFRTTLDAFGELLGKVNSFINWSVRSAEIPTV